ncbi:MAG: hypothetical protein ACRDMJ_08235 [Solirubrobacteraceae bacterium]
MAAERDSPTPAEQVARLWERAGAGAARAGERLWEQAEADAARASERLVGSGGFSALLGQLAENTAALAKLSGDAMDLAWRNLRVAGRRDVVRLARQLSRTEDKLERVLQEVEALRDELALRDADGGRDADSGRAGNGSTARGPDRPTGARRAKR